MAAGGFAPPPARVTLTPATIRRISDELEAIGTTYANESVVITAQVTDTVSRVNFEDGDFVEAGDVLVELTNEEETALLAEAKANVEDARRQHERFEDLLTQQSVPVSQVDEALARLEAAEARYQSIVARLDDRLVRSPFAGRLGFRQVSPGTLATPGTGITTLDDISIIKLDFKVPEIHLGAIRPGLRLRAMSPAYPDRDFGAQVTTIGSRVDPVTRAATVRAHIENRDLLLRPGMLMVIRLTTSERNALMVPETAILQRGEEVFVFTVDDGRMARMTTIESGVRRDGWVEVETGLAEGDPVISEGIIKVRDNSPVAPAQQGEAVAERDSGERPAGDS